MAIGGPIMKHENYIDFLKSKIDIAPESGFDVDDLELSPILKPHQRDAVKWAIKGGRRALFESFGLGKTLQQLEIMRIILSRKSGKGLIVCPLEVRAEFIKDAKKIGLAPVYCRNIAEIESASSNIIITNYERVRDGDIDPKYFTICTLDEASVLRGYGTKTYQEFLTKFKGVEFKYVATATPSPNKFKELIHYAGFLEVMDTGQALTRFFKRDSTQANNLTLYPGKEKEFWFWMSTWALFLTIPSDLGYSDEGYDLPPMEVIYHKVEVDHSTAGAEDDGQIKLFRDASMGLKDASKEKRESIDNRVSKMMEIIQSFPEDHFILWHDLEAERAAIKKALPESKEIYGSQDPEIRAKHALDFSEGKIKYLATKPEISGSGCNFQYHCHQAIFVGIGYKFNDLIQAIHRIYRYMQSHAVKIHIIYTESEQAVLDTLLKKWEQHKHLTKEMTTIMRENGLNSVNVSEKLMRTLGLNRNEIKGKNYRIVNNDSCLEFASLPENSIDLIHTSIPFGNHYEYSASYNDFGHNTDNERFFEQMDYLTPHLLRTLKPGRIAAIHVKDRILFGNATGTGMPTVDPFSDFTVMHYMKHGFQYMGRITVVTDVVRENAQTYRLGWTENSKDGTKMGIGCPEYVLLFRKLPTDTSKAYADTPVVHPKDKYSRGTWQIDAHAFWRSSGDRQLTIEEMRGLDVGSLAKAFKNFTRSEVYNYVRHSEIATELDKAGKLPSGFQVIGVGSWHPDVWDDVNRMRTFNGEQARKDLEFHVCPLQFDIVERIIERYSNPGELIADPFGGLMTVPYMAVKMNRKGFGCELNPTYFHDGSYYMKDIDSQVGAPTLFDLELS
jgi:DNA modification methylase